MQIWITFILINIIHQTHVSAAPVDSSFAKIADTIINPAWIKNNPDSPKENGENIPIDGEIDYSNTKNKKKNNSRRKNKTSSKKRNNNKTRNNRRRNNTGHNERYLWYSVFTVDDLIVNLPEYRNHEDEQKIVLIWDDKRKIVQNEHVDTLSMYNLNNNQLIRQKRDYNNILELQDNILKTKNINQHDLEENENSMSSNSNENTNENMEFLNLRNSNTNKLKNILKNRKQPTNTIRNEISRPSHAQGLGIHLGADNSEKEESQLKIIKENPQKKNAKTTLSNDKPELIIGENTSIEKNTPEIEKIDTLINGMNSNLNEGADYEQDSESYPLTIEPKNKIQNYSYIVDNKQHDIIKNIKHQFKPKTRQLEKKQPKNNGEGILQTRFTLNAPSKNEQKTPSIPEHKIEGNTNIAKNITTNDEIETLLNAMNSNSQENSTSKNSDLSTSSLEKQQDILDLSDLGDNKQNNLLKSIKQPLKPISKIEGKTLLENNEKQPEIYEKYINNPSETNTKNKKGSQLIGNTPSSQSIKNQQTPSINVPGHITPEHTDISQNIPSNVEIKTLKNAINLNSEEEGKTLLENNEKQPEIYEKYLNNPSETNTKNKKGSQLIGNTPSSQSIKNQKTPSIDIPEHKTEGNTDISQNIPSNVEIETLMNAINLNSEENSSSKNSDLNTSSLEKRQDIQDLSDLGDNKQNNLLKSIKQPLKPITKIEGKTLLENNEKQPEIYEKYINNPSETNTKNKKGSQLIGNTPSSQSIKNQQTPSINVPGHITPEHTDISQNIPSNVEIKTLKNAINLNSEENSFSKNSDLNTSSLEKQQDILDLSDLGDNKGKNLLKSIIQPLKPLSKMEEKKMLENNEKLPGIYKQKFNNSLEINKNDEEGPQQKTLTPITQNLDQDSNVEAEKLQPIPTNNDDIPNIIQKNKSIKTPDLIDTTVPKSTEKVMELATETPLNDIDVSDSLEEYNKLGGFTMKDAGLEIIKDETPSSTLNYNSMKDHDDSLQVTNQPMLMKPNTVNPNTEHKEGVHINIDEVPKSVSDGKEKKKLVDKFGSNSYADLFGGSLDFNEEDLSQPAMNKKKVIPISKTNDIIKNVGDEKLQPIPTKNDDIPNIIQKNKSIKTPDLIDTTVPKATEKVIGLTTETPLNDIDVSDSLGEYNKLGGFTMEDAGLEIIKDETPSSTLNYNSMKDHDDSLQVTNQPMLMKPNTVKPNTEHKEGVHINIDEVPKSVSDGKEKKKFVDEFGSNSYADLFGGSLNFNEEDLSQPAMNKKKVIPISKTNDIIKNVGDEKLQPIPTKNDDIPNIIQKNKSIKTPDLIDTTVPKATEKVIGLTTETPLNDIDVSDSLGDYNKLGGFTMEDAGLEIIKDETPSSTLNYNSMKDHDDSLQVTNQPMLMKPNTVNPNTEHKEGVHINIDEVPKSVSDGKEKKKLVDEFGSNSYADLFGGSLDFNEEDLSQPAMNKKKVIPISKTNDIIKNVGDEKLQPIPTKNDDIPNIIQKNKSIKTPDLIDTTVPKATEKVIGLTTETPLNDIDVSDSLGDYNKLGGFTMEDAGLEIIKDETPSSTLNYNSIKDHDDSLQVTNQPMLMKPNTVKPNTEHKEGVHINIDEVPKSVSDGKEKKKFTTQINYDILKNDNKLPSSKILSNVIDKHSSNSNTIHKYNNNLFDNDKDVTFNRSLITNPCVEYNSKDLSSLEDGDRYGYMLPKFSTKYSEGGESNFNLWETIPPKKNDDVSSDKGYDNLINDFNQSSDFTTKNNEISSHTLNENNIVTGTESVKNNNCNIDKVNTDIHNKQYDDLIKKMSEQLFKKIDNIDDKLAKLDKVSHNSSYVREIGNIGSHEPTMNNGLLSNGIPISKPEKVINIEDSYSKTTKPSSLEINTSNKSDDENEINKNESPKAKKHKNKKHKRHGNKKKDEKNNTSNDDDGEDDYDDDDDDDNDDDEDDDNDDDNYDDNRKNNKRHKHKDKHNDDDGKNKRHKNKDLNNDDDGKHKQNKRHKNKDINNDDDGKHKKNKRHKNKDLNDNDNGEHKKNKGHKKNKKIDNDNDNGGHRKKSHKKIYNKVDDDVVSKHKKHKSNKKKDRNYNDVELLQSKMTDNKKKKKIKENVYSTEESNDVNYSSSIQINSENSDSVKRLKTTSSKSKISKKTNSTKSKKSSPKKKSKSVKHSKTIKYKNKEIPVDVSDEDTSSNENNYNSEKTYIKYISNNNQNNVPKDKKHKHKKHNKHSKTSKTYINKKIPEDKDSDENSVNLEETYNINIISDDDAPRQKNHRHKKKKNFDINIVKDTDTDTDTQVLNNDKKPQAGYQFYALYPQYRYATLNPFARLLTNSYLG
ncbi:hypothetical protein AGLY_013165 [Aphis glycines]|uniref:Uncharacterized protein n=1 Tax=Aphis glycines TaxID=307491 RepID=A0A6G0T5Q1_APHGL|nr:hypothetical protein AGLY_013165 [Aphis glycines]